MTDKRNGFSRRSALIAGGALAATDILGGHVQMYFSGITSMVPFIKSGKVRGLAVTSAKRSSVVPELPTIAESGAPGFQSAGWFGVLAPAGTPRPIIDRMNTELLKIVRDPKVIRDKYEPVGMSPMTSTPEEFAEVMKKDLVKYQGIAKAAGIKPE